jgi:uncharacterized protein with HEPN domain
MFDSANMLHILTILEAIEKVMVYAEGFEDEEELYRANKQLNFNGIVNLLIAIGEENKKVDEGLKTSSLLNWKNVSAMRDKISHNYRGIDESIVWNIIYEYLPKLKTALIEVTPQIENYKLYIQEALESPYYEDLGYLKEMI